MEINELFVTGPEPTDTVLALRERYRLDRCDPPLKDHQVIGVHAGVTKPYFFLADEMGGGKTAQTIIAACLLFEMGVIDRVLVIAPSSVCGVWFDPALGEIVKHSFKDLPLGVEEYKTKIRSWNRGTGRRLEWKITNFELIRSKTRLEEVINTFTGHRTLLVLDESSALKNHRAKQTKACLQIRNRCARVILLNGTPCSQSPLDLYSQARMMHQSVLGAKDFYQFRARHAIITTQNGFPKIIGFQNLEQLQRQLKPFILRRLKKDCWDLPEKMPAVPIPFALTPTTWRMYREMRDELCVFLDSANVSEAAQAVVKVLRLAQLVCGFIGGVHDVLLEDTADHQLVREIGSEKHDAIVGFIDDLLEAEPNLKLLIWSRFRPEIQRLGRTLADKFDNVGYIHGGQTASEREESVRLLDPRVALAHESTVVLGTTQTGRTGLNLTAAHHVIYASSDFSLFTRQQSEDRTHRPGQVCDVSYFDFIATGPSGQKTVDHLIMKSLRDKANVAEWLMSAWVTALREE